MPEVLHALGQAWWEVGLKKPPWTPILASYGSFLTRLLFPTPGSSFGEYYFENQDLENAIKSYKKAATYTQSKVRPFAEYKLAWTTII